MAIPALSATSATSLSSAFVANSLHHNHRKPPKPVLGLPLLSKCGTVTSMQNADGMRSRSGFTSLSLASALVATQPALALVDDRMTTEGTGLGLGISNPALAWILLGVALTVWALYFIYASGLPEGDDDSGLSL